METTTQTVNLSPLEKLCLRKREIKTKTKEYEEKISADVDFMQEHAGTFLISGFTSMLFPKTHKAGSHSETKHHKAASNDSFNVMSLAKGLILPAALSLAQPLLLSWGLGKVPTWIINFIIKRLKKK